MTHTACRRVDKIDKIAKTDPTFPKPVTVLHRIRVWDTDAIERWAREAERIK